MNKTQIAEIFQNQSIGTSSWLTIVFTLVMAFAVGLFIFWVYKKNYRGVMFSNNFGLTLVLMTVITAPVVLCIRNSIELSMGMVGALSIVRFRTAVKDPLDTGYMFWALTMGILLGAGQYFLAAVTVVGIAAIVFALRYIINKGSNSYLLVLRTNAAGEAAANKLMEKLYHELKSKTVSGNGLEELTYEIRVEKANALVARLHQTEGIKDVSLVAYQSETV